MDEKELMTLYAGLAMQGIIAAGNDASPQSIAKVSFDIAQAMVREQGERNERLRPTQSN